MAFLDIFMEVSHTQSCSVSKETSDVTVTRGMLWSNEVCIITVALLHEFVYEFRVNNTYRISSYKTRGYYFFTEPSTEGIIRMRVLFEG